MAGVMSMPTWPSRVAAIDPGPALVEALVDELLAFAVTAVDRRTLAALVKQAVDDLRGSVSAEALPEMAVRLAAHRVAQRSVPA